MKILPALLGGLAIAAIPTLTASATVYSGNTGTGFNGSVGYGLLTVTSNATAGTFTFTESPSSSTTQYTAGGAFGSGNVFVLYIDSVTGGFTNTSTFTDTGNPAGSDGGREAISGYNASGGTRTTATFATNFAADYAISFDDSGNTDLFQLNSTTFNYVTMGATATPYTITVSAANLGLTTVSNASLKFVGSLISNTAYRSSEAIGSATLAGTALQSSGNPGFSNGITYSNFNTFAVPEPGPVAALGIGGFVLAGFAVRRGRARI